MSVAAAKVGTKRELEAEAAALEARNYSLELLEQNMRLTQCVRTLCAVLLDLTGGERGEAEAEGKDDGAGAVGP